MHIREFTKPVTAKKLNESLAQRFGQKIDLDRFTVEQLQDVRNKLRTKLSQITTTESFDSVQKEDYQKNKLFLDVLNAAISERGSIAEDIDTAINAINEGAEDTAELVMAAKDMVDRLTGWMEDTAEMQTESMLELADAIRAEMGPEKADQFTNAIKPALDTLYQTMETTRVALTQGVGMLTGEEEPMDTMGADDTGMEPTTDMDTDMDMGDEGDMTDMPSDDEFGAAEPAVGGEEEGGRAKRESRNFDKKLKKK